MSKSSVASAPKIPASQLPSKSAWSKGPPQSASPRSQSPAPPNSAPAHPTHSRRPSTLGQGIPIKDGVSIPRNNVGATKTGSAVSFGSIDDASAPISSSPAATPAIKASAEGVKSFGSVPATLSQMNGKSSVSASTKPPLSQASSSASISGASTSSSASSAPAAKVDVRKFFMNVSSSPSASPDTSSPSTRPANLPPQSSSSGGPMGTPQFTSFVPMRAPPNSSAAGAPTTPRSPNYPRQQMSNGNGPRPPNNANAPPGPSMQPPMGSPRMASHPHPGQQPNVQPPQMQPPVQMPGWNPYYYPIPGMPHETYMYPPPPWGGYGMPPQQMPPHPQQHPSLQQHHPSQGGPHPMPMSPRNPHPPLQGGPPGTPTPSHASAAPHSPHPLPLSHSSSNSMSGLSSPPPTPSSASMPGSARLNTDARAFVPRPTSKIVIKRDDGSELDLQNFKQSQSHQSTPIAASPITSPPSGLNSPKRAIPIIAPDSKKKREEEAQAKAAALEKERKAKEEAERKAKEEKEREERIKKEKEERIKKEKEEAERKEKEKAEAERKAREKEEAERKAKEEEEERERRRIKAEEEEKARLAEEERLREEERLKAEAEEKLRKEEEERKKKEEEEEQARLRQEEEEAAAKAKAEEEEALALAQSKADEPEEGELIEDVSSTDSPEEKPSESITEDKKPLRIDTTPIEPLPGKRRPGPLDLSTVSGKPNIPAPLPSALATARIIDDLGRVPYPEGVRSPKVELNVNAKDGKFRYDRDFLMQFMSICKEKPDNLPPLDAIGLESQTIPYPMVRGGSQRGNRSGAAVARSPSLNVGPGFKPAAGGPFGGGMGHFGATSSKLTSEERYQNANRTVSMGAAIPLRPTSMQRTASSGGPGSQMHTGRTRSKRGDKRTEANKAPSGPSHQHGGHVTYGPGGIPLEPVAPLQMSENRWDRKTLSAVVDPDSPEVVDRKVKALLNKLTMEKFDSISDQIITWANKSEKEKDGRTLIQVIRLVFEKATDEATWSEMYARLCRKMMEQISPKVQDDGIKNSEGKPIAGGHLFRKYLLNRCQEDFERGWVNKEATAAAAATKAIEDKAAKAASESKGEEEVALYSDEYYAPQKAKRQGLGLIKFIGELFKLQMLTERIMHECVKKLLGNVENPEEEEIESLCKLLTTVGAMLDTAKARAHMNVYFDRMKELTKSQNVNSRMQYMLQDIIELRERKWQQRNTVAAPTTIAKIHEAAAKEKAAAEKESFTRLAMSRPGSHRGGNRNESQAGPDGWTVTGNTPRPPPKAGDLSKFGQISSSSKGTPMTFGPSSVFAGKKDSKRESLSRTNSSANMFQMLQNVEAAEAISKSSRPPSRKTSIDLGPGGVPEPAPQRKRLILQPRTRPVEAGAPTQESDTDSDEEIMDDSEQEMSDEEAKKKISEDTKEFFGVRNLDEAEVYFAKLPSSHHHSLVDKLVSLAIESKETDAKLVGEFFERASSKKLCSPLAFEEGFNGIAEFLDDIAIDAPKATDLFAIMVKGAGLSEEQRTAIASKSAENGDKLLTLSS